MSDDFCSLFNLTDTQSHVCAALANRPLTPNFLYYIFKIIKPKLPFLTNNLKDIAVGNANKMTIFSAILVQLPWLFCFWALELTLLYLKNITPRIFIGLVILSVLVTAILLIVYLSFIKHNVMNLINDTKNQIKTNFAELKKFWSDFIKINLSLNNLV